MGQKHPYPKYLPNNILYIISIRVILTLTSVNKKI